MGMAAGGASLLSTGLGLASSIMGAEGTQAADEMQAAQLEQQAQLGQAAAVEASANEVTRLNQALGNIDAVSAARGNDITSPTTAALRGNTTMLMNQQKTVQVGNILQQSAQDTASANYLNQAGSFALTQGILGGVAGAAGALGKTNFSSFGLPSLSSSFNFTND